MRQVLERDGAANVATRAAGELAMGQPNSAIVKERTMSSSGCRSAAANGPTTGSADCC